MEIKEVCLNSKPIVNLDIGYAEGSIQNMSENFPDMLWFLT